MNFDIVEFWKETSEHYNQINKCGFCWSFGAPLVKSQINISKPEVGKECCANIFLTDLSYESLYKTHSITNDSVISSCLVHFNLYILVQGELGVNNYNEIKEHPISESKYEKVFKPLANCFGCGVELNLCKEIDFNKYGSIIIKKWGRSQIIHNWQDLNFDGWLIPITFEIPMI